MYDWPEARAETDLVWGVIRERLRNDGIAAPDQLSRRNGDLPAVPGGMMDRPGRVLAADPAELDPDQLALPCLWYHPNLLLAQTCWGPMEQGLEDHVALIGQPDYSAYEGGDGALYSSALLMRRDYRPSMPRATAPGDRLPMGLLRGARFAFNGNDSMSGLIGLRRDLAFEGEGLSFFSVQTRTGSHRGSIRAVATGNADLCAIDCRTLDLARRFEPAMKGLVVIGWTSKRKGLPFIMSPNLVALRPALIVSMGENLVAEPA